MSDHFNIMPSLIRKRKMDVIVVEAVQPEPEAAVIVEAVQAEAAVIDEEVQPEAVIEVEDEEGQPEITEGQLEMQPDVENEETQPQPPSDHYVRREFFRNLISGFTLIVSLYLTDTEINTIKKGAILNLICGTLLVPLNEYIIYKLEGGNEGHAQLKKLLKTLLGAVFGFLLGGIVVIVLCNYYPEIGARATILFLASGVIFLLMGNYEDSFIRLRGGRHTLIVVICCQIAMALTFFCTDEVQNMFNNPPSNHTSSSNHTHSS